MLTRILETDLRQGVEPIKLLQRAMSGVWGKDGDTLYNGNLVTKIQMVGEIKNEQENPAIVLLILDDNSVKGYKLEKDEVINEDYIIALLLTFN